MIVILSWIIFRGKFFFFIYFLEVFKLIVVKWKSKNKFEIYFKKLKWWNLFKKERKKKEKDNLRCEVVIFFKDFLKKRGGFLINMIIRGN